MQEGGVKKYADVLSFESKKWSEKNMKNAATAHKEVQRNNGILIKKESEKFCIYMAFASLVFLFLL